MEIGGAMNLRNAVVFVSQDCPNFCTRTYMHTHTHTLSLPHHIIFVLPPALYMVVLVVVNSEYAVPPTSVAMLFTN